MQILRLFVSFSYKSILQISVAVSREYGAVGEVRVFYSTTPGSATSLIDVNQDFHAASGWLDFRNNQRRMTIGIDIIDDNIAEGPEEFFLNITGVELLQPV